MRDCFDMYCDNGDEIEYDLEDNPIKTGSKCQTCKGTGKVEDGCYCAARSPGECMCGAWDDVDMDTHYGDSDYN